MFPIRRAFPKPNLMLEGGELTQCQFFCLVKRHSINSLTSTTSPIQTNLAMTEEVFTLRLEPFPPGFNVVSVDTSRMSDASAASLSKMELNRRSIMELCHPQDRNRLVDHLNECVNEAGNPTKNSVTKYRARLVDCLTHTGGWVRVRLRTIMLRPSPQSATISYISAQHTVIDPAELLAHMDDNVVPPFLDHEEPKAHITSEKSGGLLMAHSDNNKTCPKNQSNTPKELAPENSNNNNTIQSKSLRSRSPSSPSASSTDETQEKNLLLKQLLNVNYSRGESPNTSSSEVQSPPSLLRKTLPTLSVTATAPNSGILKLLSQHTGKDTPRKSLSPTESLSDEELQPRPLAGVKRSAGGSLLSHSPTTATPRHTSQTSASGDTSSVCKENPALISLLSKPTTNSVAVPPPVPTKWHQEPREKLPRTEDGLKQFLPPHPAERSAGKVHVVTPATLTLLQNRMRTSERGSYPIDYVYIHAQSDIMTSPGASSKISPSQTKKIIISEMLQMVPGDAESFLHRWRSIRYFLLCWWPK